MKKLKLVISEDGSHTLYREDINEHYHSIHGAVQESNHVFIEKGLNEVSKLNQSITILEIGFGTGLNAFLTCLQSNITIKYIGIEAFPIGNEIVQNLNYSKVVNNEKGEVLFQKIHTASWDSFQNISDLFSLKKIQEEIQLVQLPKSIDLVYFDAFAPNIQPELWTKNIFQKIYDAMSCDGVFVTYCAKGQVRRDLQEVGFSVERLEGPPGKREMIRARKLL